MLINQNNKRILYTIFTVVLLALEVYIALFVHDDFIRPYVGDILVVVVLYTFTRIFVPEGVKHLPLYIFVFSACVELLQLMHVVEILHLENNTFFRILIGSTFDVKDIICYGIGCIGICIVQTVCK